MMTAPDPDAQIAYCIWLFGPFTVQRSIGQRGKVVETTLNTVPSRHLIDESAWKGTQSKLILKMLLCHPRRSLKREVLVERLWPESNKNVSSAGFTRALGALKEIFGECIRDQGGIISCDMQRVWTDTDAVLHVLEQASSITDPHSCITYCETAMDYFKRGSFLEDDDGSWIYARKAFMENKKHSCRSSLLAYYEQIQAYAKAEALLQSELEDGCDEDLLCSLLTLYAQWGKHSQAIRTFKYWCAYWEAEGEKCPPKVKQLVDYIYRQWNPVTSLSDRIPMTSENLPLDGRKGVSSSGFPTVPSKEGTMIGEGSIIAAENGIERSLFMPGSFSRRDVLHMGAAFAGTLTDYWGLQTFAQVSHTIIQPQHPCTPVSFVELEEYTTSLWHNRVSNVSPRLHLYRQICAHVEHIHSLLKNTLTPTIRATLCDLLARSSLLAGALLYDMRQYANSRFILNTSIQASLEAKNSSLAAIAWGWTSFTWIYSKHYHNALTCILQGNELASHGSDKRVQAWIAAIQGEIHANLGQREQCFRHLQLASSVGEVSNGTQDLFPYFGHTQSQSLGFIGVCMQKFYRRDNKESLSYLHESQNALKEALRHQISDRRKITYYSDLATTFARIGDLEQMNACVKQAVDLANRCQFLNLNDRLLEIEELTQPYTDSEEIRRFQSMVQPILAVDPVTL